MENKTLKQELNRCIKCKVSPCAKGCPLGLSPHDFISLALQNEYTKAAELIRSQNPFAETCGKICPDTFCQKKCLRGKIDFPLNIPSIQAHIAQKVPATKLSLPASNGKHIAIIGGGPAGLGACWQLLQYGYHVSIYEKENKLGGALRLIPDYRLDKAILDKEISYITSNERTTIYLNQEITDFEHLKTTYDNIILALGEQTPHTLRTQGEEYATPYKEVLKSPSNYTPDKVCVVGGGEVALDCALTLKRQGAKTVEMFVRRRQTDMKIMSKDFLSLKQENILIRELTSITSIQKEADQTLTLNTIQNFITEDNKSSPLLGTDNTLSGYDLVITALGSTCPNFFELSTFPTAGDMTKTTGTLVEALASGIKLAQTFKPQ